MDDAIMTTDFIRAIDRAVTDRQNKKLPFRVTGQAETRAIQAAICAFADINGWKLSPNQPT
jgi:hypothetical protein